MMLIVCGETCVPNTKRNENRDSHLTVRIKLLIQRNLSCAQYSPILCTIVDVSISSLIFEENITLTIFLLIQIANTTILCQRVYSICFITKMVFQTSPQFTIYT